MNYNHTINEVNKVLANLHDTKSDLRKMQIIPAYERVDGAINVLKTLRDRLAKESSE